MPSSQVMGLGIIPLGLFPDCLSVANCNFDITISTVTIDRLYDVKTAAIGGKMFLFLNLQDYR